MNETHDNNRRLSVENETLGHAVKVKDNDIRRLTTTLEDKDNRLRKSLETIEIVKRQARIEIELTEPKK